MTSTTRTTCATGQAEILVVDFMVHLWDQYEAALPEGSNHLLTADTTSATQAVADNPGLHTVIVQGLSRQHAGDQDSDNLSNTVQLVVDLIGRGFPGRIMVVSNSLTAEMQWVLRTITPTQVKTYHKSSFLRDNQAREIFKQPAMSELQDGYWECLESATQPRFKALARYTLPSAQAFECMVESLSEFKATLRGGNPRKIYEHLVQLNLFQGDGDCTCAEDYAFPYGDWRWIDQIHAYHGTYNKAVWELLSRYPGLLPLLRQELELDLSHPDTDLDPGDPFGRFARKSYGRRLLTFLGDSSSTNGIILPHADWFIAKPTSLTS
jgi:hypothetical protein